MSFIDNFFDKLFAPFFTIDGITFGFLDLLFISLPFCIIAAIIVTVLEYNRRK